MQCSAIKNSSKQAKTPPIFRLPVIRSEGFSTPAGSDERYEPPRPLEAGSRLSGEVRLVAAVESNGCTDLFNDNENKIYVHAISSGMIASCWAGMGAPKGQSEQNRARGTIGSGNASWILEQVDRHRLCSG